MTDPKPTTTDDRIAPTIRRIVRDADGIDHDSLVALVAIECDRPQRPVRGRINELERLGEIYIAGEEVRLP